MNRTIFNKSGTLEERVGFIEVVLSRLAKRVHKTTTAIVPPHIVSACKTGDDVRGDILKTMLFEGTITKGLICFGKKPKNPVCVEIKLLNNTVGFSKSYYVNRMRESVSFDVSTVDGSILTISVHPTVEDEKDKITEVWISLLWNPKLSNAKIKQYLIENLERVSEENVLEE